MEVTAHCTINLYLTQAVLAPRKPFRIPDLVVWPELNLPATDVGELRNLLETCDYGTVFVEGFSDQSQFLVLISELTCR